MALLPYLLDDLLYERPVSHLYDQSFGHGLLNDDLVLSRPSIMALSTPLMSGYLRPHRHSRLDESGISTVMNDKDGLKINLDVQQFKPEEINVKIVDDYVVVEGKHEERQDKHGFVSRQFSRRYRLPGTINVDALKSSLSSDGILSITAPKKAIVGKSDAREIKVVRTNQPAIKPTNKSGNADGDKMET